MGVCKDEEFSLFVTHILGDGPFLHVFGNRRAENVRHLERVANSIKNECHFHFAEEIDEIKPGLYCLARSPIDNKLYRAKVCTLHDIAHGLVYVQFIDYGNKGNVHVTDILIIQKLNNLDFFQIPPQAEEFIIAEIANVNCNWDNLKCILLLPILHREHTCKIVSHLNSIPFIELNYKNHVLTKLILDLVPNNFTHMFIAEQEKLFTSYLKMNGNMCTSKSALNGESLRYTCTSSAENISDEDIETTRSFKSRPALGLHSRYEITITAIEEGTLIFSVQLLQLKKFLERLMMNINNQIHSPFQETPNNGCICLGRKSSDGLLYRAVIMGIENTSSLKLYFVDYGTIELVSFSNIFQIGAEFVRDKIFTYRFTLQGMNAKTNFMSDFRDIFSTITMGQVFELEVVRPEGPPIAQYCQLYLEGRNIKDVINEISEVARGVSPKNQSRVYKKINVSKSCSYEVEVSYIESVNQFNVQLCNNKGKLDELMSQLFIYCQSAPALSIHDLQVNMPCAALYAEDQTWYRAMIESVENDRITVRYVDYGNSEEVSISSLKVLNSELFLRLEAQAIMCNLFGVECVVPNASTTAQLEMLCLDKTIVLTVIDYDVAKHCALVDLKDCNIDPPLNISKRIIELSMPQKKLGHNNNEESSHMKRYSNTQANLQSSFGSEASKLSSNNITQKRRFNTSGTLSTNTQNERQNWRNNSENGFSRDGNRVTAHEKISLKTFMDEKVLENQKVVVSWFINPNHFYCQLRSKSADLIQLMKDIQAEYNKEKHTDFSPEQGCAVIVHYKEDSTFYRGEIIDQKPNHYVIDFVDYGFKNLVALEDVYPIKENFMAIPKMAIRCKIGNILPNKTKLDISQAWELFKKEEYECLFNENAKGFMVVDLKYDGDSVSSRLIEKGFAIRAAAQINEEIEFALLCGQTVRGTILGVLDFQRFFVKLYGTNSQLECALYNWTCDQTSPELADLKKAFQKMITEMKFIIFINEVQNTKLFVTLYDSLGSKIKCLSSDQSYPTISPLCPKIVLRSSMSAQISHIEDKRIFIQDTEDQDRLDELLDGLFAYYENEGKNLYLEICEHSICAAKSVIDENWYRGKILKVSDDGILVRYIDYGNTELLPANLIRELHSNYFEINELCLETVADSNFTNDSVGSEIVKINLAQIAEGWKLVLPECNSPQNILKTNTTDLEISQDVGYVTSGNIDCTDQMEIENSVFISHIDSPGEFWIQYQNTLDDLHSMHTNLQGIAEKLPLLTNLQVGKKCVAKYMIDEQWYRAEILDADVDITTVRFIDYGNTDVISNTENIIKEIEGSVMSSKIFARRCSLMALPIDGEEWSENACKEFEHFANQSDCFAVDIIRESEKCCYISIKFKEEDICEKLISKNFAKAIEPIIAVTDEDNFYVLNEVTLQKKPGYISHFVDLSEFYVQLECDRTGLEYLEETFADASSYPIINDVMEDIICVALFDEDNQYYRASVRQILEDSYEVFFIDYGNIAITTELRELPSCVEDIGQLAKQCSLSVPQEVTKFDVDAGAKLNEISADGLTIFDIEFLTSESPYKVKLYMSGKDIVNIIYDNQS